MANNHNSAPNEQPHNGIEDEMLRGLVKRKAKEPELFHDLATKLWNDLSPAERDFQTTLIADFIADGDFESLEQAVRIREYVAQMLLVRKHVELQAEVAEAFLGEVVELPERPHPIDLDGHDKAA
jgi:hypothetical protein